VLLPRLRISAPLLCIAVVLTLTLARPTSALWDVRPPECDGGCFEDDNRNPLARCAAAVVHEAVTDTQADALVALAEAFAAEHGWSRTRHAAFPTTDLPWNVLPASWHILNHTFAQMETDVRRRCGVRPEDKLVPNDIFIVKYAPGEQPGLSRHRDGSLISFNLVLSRSTDYQGGGTLVWDAREIEAKRETYWREEFPLTTSLGEDSREGDRDRGDVAPSADGGVDADGVRTAGGKTGVQPSPHSSHSGASTGAKPASMPSRYEPRVDLLRAWDATLYRLNKGDMLVHGGFNAHQGENVSSGTRYIVAGFVGHNRHCCSIKYAGWRGIIGFMRVFMISGTHPDILDQIPSHDFLLYQEGLGMLWKNAKRLVLFGTAFAAEEKCVGVVATCCRLAMGAWVWLTQRARSKRKSLLPEKIF